MPRHNPVAVRYVADTGFMYSTTAAGSPLAALLKSLGQADNAGTQANGVSNTVAFDPSFRPPMAQKNASQASADVAGTTLEGSTAPINAAEDIAGVLGNLGRKLMQNIGGQTIFGAGKPVGQAWQAHLRHMPLNAKLSRYCMMQGSALTYMM